MFRHETPNPSTSVGVNAETGEGVYGEGRVKMVKKARDVKEEDHPYAAHSNGLLGFMTECGGSVRSGVVGAGPKLSRTEEVEVVDVGAEPVHHHLLEELPTALEEGDGAVGFGCQVVWFVWFGDDDDRRRMPGVDPKVKCCL